MARKYITLKELEHLDACYEAREAFEEKFGKRALLRSVIRWTRKIGQPDWEEWLLYQSLSLAKAAIANGADIHKFGGDALYSLLCCWNGSEKEMLPLLTFLLKSGADADENDGSTLTRALYSSLYDTAHLLLNHGAKLREATLLAAIRSGNIDSVRFCIDRAEAIVGSVSARKLLSTACAYRNVEIADLVIRISYYKTTEEERSQFLKHTVNNGYWEIAKILRNRGAHII